MSIESCFDKAALSYDSYSNVQKLVGKKLLGLINEVESVIDLGCGTGFITEQIKCKKLYALDISEQMLSVAKKRLGYLDISYIKSNLADVKNLQVDLAFSNMALQWSEDLENSLENIKNILKPNGVLAFSIPLEGSFADLNISKISFYNFDKIKKLLSSWQEVSSFIEEIDEVFPSLIEGLKALKAVGANYCDRAQKKFISRSKTPQVFKYNIGYFVVKK